nr:PREDICTED: protein spaetzle-like isoform X1 [Megachile rotundata]
MRRGYDNLIVTFLKLCILVLAAQCILAYPYRVNQNERRIEQFSNDREILEEIIESDEELSTERRFRREASSYGNEQRSSRRTSQAEIKFVFPEDIKRVPACKNSTYCETVSSYPADLVNRAIQRNESIKYLESVDVIDLSPVEERIGQMDDIPLCTSSEHVIFPQSAQNKNKEWKFVANQENFKQGVRVETCMQENASCSAIGGLAEGYKTTCRQRYVYRQLKSITEDGNLVDDTFRLPSSCCCHVSFSGNVLTRMGVNIGGQKTQVTPVKTRKRK